MKRLLLWVALALSCVTLCCPVVAADAPDLPGGIELPVRVRVAFRVLNLLQIEEVAGQGRMFVEVAQRWSDPRLRFDAIEQGFGRIDRIGTAADDYLKSVWTPGLTIENQIGAAESRTVAVSTYANGDVAVIERFEAKFRFKMNMDAFPFDVQDLTVAFALPRYAKQEAILVSTEADRQISGLEESLASVEWRAVRLTFVNEESMGWNARSFSKLNATATVSRIASRYLLRIFIPIIAVLAVSIFVLWCPGLGDKDKGGLIFSSLLALAAISFTFESSFPGCISLNTPVAQIISLGYLYLVGVLLIEMVLTPLLANQEGRFHPGWVALRRQIRWALPVMMIIVCAGAAVRAIPA